MSLSPRLLAAVSAFTLTANADIRFGPVLAGAGQSVHLVSHTTTIGGTVKLEKNGRVSNGKIQYSRDRDLTWTFRNPAEDGSLRGMVAVSKIATFSTTTIDGQTEKSDETSPLNGKMFAMSKPVKGDWKFELDGSVPLRQTEHEISELSLYLKRQWYPQRTVKIGESWEFDPAWIRMLIERNLKDAQTIGTMNLRQIRHTASGGTAVITVSVRSTGGDFRPDGTESSAQIELSGEVLVNLKTMLDESLDLKGTVVSRTGTPGETRTVTLPVHLEVTKKLINN
ncbi:MAG: hypothetical protein V4689_02885 [Verrucomicrobiota bacterium]